jgi:hypothetical protein
MIDFTFMTAEPIVAIARHYRWMSITILLYGLTIIEIHLGGFSS